MFAANKIEDLADEVQFEVECLKPPTGRLCPRNPPCLAGATDPAACECSSPKPARAKVVDADVLREAAQAVVDEAPLLGPHNLVCVVDPKKIDALRKALKGS